MKTIIKIAIALIIGCFIGYLLREGDSCPHYFHAGYDVAHSACEREREYFEDKNAEYKNRFNTDVLWSEGPPYKIMSDCLVMCKNEEIVTLKEYTEKYHASRMTLDNPTK